MKKGRKKEKVGFSIDIDVNKTLEKYCEDNSVNKSKLVNNLIKNHLSLPKIEILECQGK